MQEQFDKRDLPFYSWNKGKGIYPKVMRIAVLLRPPFLRSDEEKNPKTRYNTGNDQVTFFIHLGTDNAVQKIRTHRNMHPSMTIEAITESLLPPLEDNNPNSARMKSVLESYIGRDDIEGLSHYIANRADPSVEPLDIKKASRCSDCIMKKITARFQEAYRIADIEQAKDYFQKWFLWESDDIVRNLLKVIIVSVLEHKLLDLLRTGKERVTLEDAREQLNREAETFLGINFEVIEHIQNASAFIPNANQYAQQTIQRLIKAHKAEIMGWGEDSKFKY